MARLLLLFLLTAGSLSAQEQRSHKTLPVGSKAPDFSLPGIDGKTYTLASFKDARVLAVIFTCNHCPTAQAYEQRIMELVKDYSSKGVQVVAINPNHPESLRLDELGWSDVGDAFEDMKVRAKEMNFNFPYLYDGETEVASGQYGPVSTPHVFIFDKERVLRYNGRIDDQENFRKAPTSQDTRKALDAVLNNQEPPPSTKVFGCSVKWIEKSNWIEKANADWAKAPVALTTIDEAGIRALLKNSSDNLRLINVWATWCGPCVVEFPSLINISRIYSERDFEFVTISADDPANQEKALKFLMKKQSAGANYIFNKDDKYKLMEAIDPTWQGALPYTVLVEPGGKVIYSSAPALWPSDATARAHARSVAAEMHAGFAPLRRHCPMNMRRAPKPRDLTVEALADVRRIEALWTDCRMRFGTSGPFLFGAFGAADAMYAPIVSRLHTYCVAVAPMAQDYMHAVMALPAWAQWHAAAAAEPWIMAQNEVD